MSHISYTLTQLIEYFAILRGHLAKVFCFLLMALCHYKHTMMQIGLVVPWHEDQPLDMWFSWVLHPFSGKWLSIIHHQRQNIEQWQLPLVRSFDWSNYCGIFKYCTSRQFLYFVTIKLPFALQQILFSMNKQNTSKSIVILPDIIFSHQLLPLSWSLHNTNWQISSLKHLDKIIFIFYLASWAFLNFMFQLLGKYWRIFYWFSFLVLKQIVINLFLEIIDWL